jgi:hypothetical protein
VAFVSEDSDFLIIGEQVSRGLKINKKSALVGLFILVMMVRLDQFIILRRDTTGVRDIINLV